jgi:hypothetical protein
MQNATSISAHRLLAGLILAYADHYDAGDAALAETLHSQLWKPFNDAIARIVAATHTALQEELIPAQITASVYAGRLIDCREALWQVIDDGWESAAIAAAINALVSSCADD